MCIIIDANVAGLVFRPTPDPDFTPVFEWLNSPRKDGRMVYGGKLAQELSQNQSVRRFLRVLQQSGHAISIPDDILEQETRNVVASGLCESNDEHIIALARISGARTLCSKDASLHNDFKKTALVTDPRGRIYQNPRHVRLLQHTKACREALSKRTQRTM